MSSTPFPPFDLESKRGEPGLRKRPAGTPGLAAWFARRMRPQVH